MKSIYPFFATLLRLQMQKVQERNLNISFPSNFLQLILKDPKKFPGHRGYIILATLSVFPGGYTQWDLPKNLQRKKPRRCSNLLSSLLKCREVGLLGAPLDQGYPIMVLEGHYPAWLRFSYYNIPDFDQ